MRPTHPAEISPSSSCTGANKRVDNAAIQKELMANTFASNRDGLMDAFRDGHRFFTKEYPGLAAGGCGNGKYIIYLAAGPPGKEYSDGLEWVDKLRKEGVTTYVVGLVAKGGAGEDSMIAYADEVAKRGGGSAPTIHRPTDLATATAGTSPTPTPATAPIQTATWPAAPISPRSWRRSWAS